MTINKIQFSVPPSVEESASHSLQEFELAWEQIDELVDTLNTLLEVVISCSSRDDFLQIREHVTPRLYRLKVADKLRYYVRGTPFVPHLYAPKSRTGAQEEIETCE